MFAISVYIMLILFLNMLIAIMGNSFARRNDHATEIKFAASLIFIIHNWDIIDWSLGDREKHRYIIAAFNQGEDNIDQELERQIECLHSSMDEH